MASIPPTSRRAGQVLTGVGALAAGAVITALPFMLVWAAGIPLSGIGGWLAHLGADPVGTLGQAWQTATSRDDGSLFVQVLALAGWVAAAFAAWAWASFLIAVVAEFTAQLSAHRRGRVAAATRLRGMRMQQRAAAALVAAIIGIFAAPALASAAPAPVSATAVTVTHTASTSAGVGHAPSTDSTAVRHTVERGEGLLDVAAQYGVPWQKLAEANYGQPQPEGQSLQPGSTRVYPGWTLTIPGVTTTSSSVQADQAAPTTADPIVYRIARGDRLHDIAERFLGDGDRYPEIAKVNPTLKERDHRFPNHIERGWRLTLPDDARDRGPTAHATGRVLTPPTATPGDDHRAPASPEHTDATPTTGDHDDAAPGTVAAPPSSVGTPSTPAQGAASPKPPTATVDPQLATSTSASAPTPASPENTRAAAAEGNASAVDDSAVALASLAGAGLLSTLLLTTVLRRRRLQQQHRRPGRQLPHPHGGATERALRVAELPADVDRLDVALRSLAGALADRDSATLPDIAAAWIVDQDVTVVLIRPCAEPPSPWTTDDGVHWVLPGTAEAPIVDGQLAPLPTLVAVGSQPGRHLLIDLERLGSITITGDPERSAALLRYLASELACNTWSDDVEVIIAGFPAAQAELLVALNPDRMRAVSSIGETTSRLRRRVSAVRAALSAAGVPNTFAGRTADVGEAWPPQVLLVVDPAEEDLLALGDLQRELRDGRCAVAVATTSSTVRQDSHALDVDADGNLDLALPFLTARSRAAGLPAQELEPLAEIMRQARAAADVPAPAAPEPESWADGADTNGALLRLFDPSKPVDGDNNGWDELLTPATSAPQEPSARQGTEPAPLPERDRILALPRITLPDPPQRREVTAALRQRRRQADPHLDADLRAWKEQDPTRPRIGVLGPVTVDAPGPAPDQRRRFHAEIIVYLGARGARGASAEQFTEALWPSPAQPIRDASRRVAISRARRWLGDTVEGRPWLPEMGGDRLYRLQEGYLLDWHLFRRLRTRGESHGAAGVKDLHAALELVRGVPLDGADRAYAAGARNPYTWLPESDIYPGHLISGVVDTAHQMAELYLDAGDTVGARWAIQQAWLADPNRGDDGPWRDLMRAAQMDGHAAGVRSLLAELMRARDAEVPEDLSKETYAWLRPMLPEVLASAAGSY